MYRRFHNSRWCTDGFIKPDSFQVKWKIFIEIIFRNSKHNFFFVFCIFKFVFIYIHILDDECPCFYKFYYQGNTVVTAVFYNLYTISIYPPAHKQLRRYLLNPFREFPCTRSLIESLQGDNGNLKTQIEDLYRDRTTRDNQIEQISVQVDNWIYIEVDR